MREQNKDRVVITGGSGFIGTNLVQAFLEDRTSVVNLDSARPRNPDHIGAWHKCDLCNLDELTREIVAFDPTAIYHLGARTDLLSDNVAHYSANTVGVQNLIRACDGRQNLRRVIFASSRLVCRIGHVPQSETDYCPTTAYGESKIIGEQIVRSMSRSEYSWTLIRPTSIWGPWFDIPYRTFFDQIKANRYFHPAGVNIRKSFGYVGNTVFQLRKIMAAKDEQVSKRTFYVGDYDAIDVLSFANTIASAFQRQPIRTVPLVALKILAKIGDQLKFLGYRHPPLTTFRLQNLCTDMLYEFCELPEITGPLPFSVERGVAQTVEWLNHFPGA